MLRSQSFSLRCRLVGGSYTAEELARLRRYSIMQDVPEFFSALALSRLPSQKIKKMLFTADSATTVGG